MARTKEFDEDKILDKAVELFWHKGYNGISAQELVDGLGLSRSSLYDTFGDKHTLFTRALNRYKAKMAIETIARLDKAEDVPEAIREVFLRKQKRCFQGGKQVKGCFMVNARVELAPHDAEIAEIVKENWQILEESFFRALQRGQTSGQISAKHDPRALSRFLVNNFWGLSVYGKADADKEVFEDIVNMVMSVLDNK